MLQFHDSQIKIRQTPDEKEKRERVIIVTLVNGSDNMNSLPPLDGRR